MNNRQAYEIKKILARKDGTMFIIVPRNSGMKKGMYVKIIEIQDLTIKSTGEQS